MCRRLKDRPLVVLEDLEPGVEVAGVIRPGFQLGHYTKIGAQKATSEFGNEFFASAVGAILVITRKIASDPVRRRRPVPVMPISA